MPGPRVSRHPPRYGRTGDGGHRQVTGGQWPPLQRICAPVGEAFQASRNATVSAVVRSNGPEQQMDQVGAVLHSAAIQIVMMFRWRSYHNVHDRALRWMLRIFAASAGTGGSPHHRARWFAMTELFPPGRRTEAQKALSKMGVVYSAHFCYNGMVYWYVPA